MVSKPESTAIFFSFGACPFFSVPSSFQENKRLRSILLKKFDSGCTWQWNSIKWNITESTLWFGFFLTCSSSPPVALLLLLLLLDDDESLESDASDGEEELLELLTTFFFREGSEVLDLLPSASHWKIKCCHNEVGWRNQFCHSVLAKA